MGGIERGYSAHREAQQVHHHREGLNTGGKRGSGLGDTARDRGKAKAKEMDRAKAKAHDQARGKATATGTGTATATGTGKATGTGTGKASLLPRAQAVQLARRVARDGVDDHLGVRARVGVGVTPATAPVTTPATTRTPTCHCPYL